MQHVIERGRDGRVVCFGEAQDGTAHAGVEIGNRALDVFQLARGGFGGGVTGGGQNGRVRSGQQAAQEGVDVLCERVLVDVLRRRAAVGVAQARVLASYMQHQDARYLTGR